MSKYLLSYPRKTMLFVEKVATLYTFFLGKFWCKHTYNSVFGGGNVEVSSL